MSSTVERSIPTGVGQAPSQDSFPPEHVLTRARSGRAVVQGFVSLAESLEWELGQRYLRERGNKSFIADTSPVPYVVNNDGTLSRHAAELLYEDLEARGEGREEGNIYVLELGIGVGLFARFFLDHFRNLCRRHDRNFYDRLCYIAADRSPRMLLDVARHGVLANHPGRYRLREADALRPGELLPYDVCFQGAVVGDQESGVRSQGSEEKGKVRAVFLNYLLDCLPAAALKIGATGDGEAPPTEEVSELVVRTCLARNVNLADFTDMSLEQLRERAKSSDPRAKQELLEVYGIFASEYDYQPIHRRGTERAEKNQGKGHERSPIPYLEFALGFGRKNGGRVLHSYGAIQCLEGLLGLVADDGFILINDYGQTEIKQDDDFEHQRFSLATFVGLSFPLLKEYFTDEKKLQWEEPFGGDAGGIHSRLLSRSPNRETSMRFQACFGRAEHDRIHEPLDRARECMKVGRFEQAAGLYEQALQRQPRNWVLLSEIAGFLTFSLRDPKAGADMAKLALDLNPACSSDLWCTLGDALFEWGRTAEARNAYLRALDINASDVRARFNLAFVHNREKNYAAALDMIAQALTLDKTGAYRERLLQKQQEVLAHLTARNQQEYLLMVNLVSKPATEEKK